MPKVTIWLDKDTYKMLIAEKKDKKSYGKVIKEALVKKKILEKKKQKKDISLYSLLFE